MPPRINAESKIKYIKELEELYGKTYDYSESEYISYSHPIIIIDRETGLRFIQSYSSHKRGKISSRLDFKFIQYIRRCRLKYGRKFEYANYKGYNKLVDIYSHELRIWYKHNAQEHLEGKTGLPRQYQNKWLSDYNVFLEKASVYHEGKFEYLNYDFPNRNVTFKCKKTGREFTQSVYEHVSGNNPIGYSFSKISKGELKLRTMVGELFPSEKILYNSRPKFLNGLELDVYIPNLNIAFEFNGIGYHHSSPEIKIKGKNISKSEDYHLQKYLKCKEAGVKLVHLYDTDIKDMANIIHLWTNSEQIYLDNTLVLVNKRGNPAKLNSPKSIKLYKPTFEFIQKT